MIFDDNLGPHGDAFFETLTAAHEGLTEADSHRLNARLVLIMGNHIGDLDALRRLIAEAKDVSGR